MKLPVLSSAKDHEHIRKKHYQRLLFVDGTRIPDPFSLHERWLSEQDCMKSWLPIYMTNIVQYAGVSDSNVNMCKFLQEYKLGKGQSFVDAKHVGEIFYDPIASNSRLCVLGSECIPSQQLRDDPLFLIRIVVSSSPPIVHVKQGDPLFCYYLQLEEGINLHLKKLESPSPKNAMWQVWLELDMWFFRSFF